MVEEPAPVIVKDTPVEEAPVQDHPMEEVPAEEAPAVDSFFSWPKRDKRQKKGTESLQVQSEPAAKDTIDRSAVPKATHEQPAQEIPP